MKSLAHLNKYFFKYKYRLLLGLAFVAINNYFGAEAKLYVGKGTDYVHNLILSHHAFNSDINWKLVGFGGLILGLVLLQAVFMFFMRQMIIVMSRLIEYDEKNEIYTHYQTLDQNFFKRNNTGDLMNRISEDVSRVRMYTGPALMYITGTVGTVAFTIPYMLHINAKLTLITLSPMPLIVMAIWYVSSLINKRSTEVQQQLSSISTFTQETYSGIRVMKAFAREESINTRFESETRKYRSLYMRLVKTEGAFQPLVVLLVGISNVLAIWFGGLAYARGEIRDFGEIISLIMFITGLTWPIASLGWVTSLVQRAAASQERINEFLQTESGIKNAGTDTLPVEGTIEFKDVTLRYEDSGVVALNKVSFLLPKGTSMAIVGRTGSGKSTVAALLTRLYEPTEGEIRIDGKQASQFALGTLRGAVGYVPQEVFLFSDSIANNIRFGVAEENIPVEQLREAARIVDIHDSIMEFPEGYETMLGERGITLSGGQKQRISMARAIIKAPSILIFDDCLSAVDTETEEHILSNLKPLMRNKSTLIISHRISSVKQCDQILVLENGSVAERGNHESLIQANGVYAALYRQQLLENQTKGESV
ncbi:MAG: ABC transporter ATP-binding protein [Bacteroidia bacterium]